MDLKIIGIDENCANNAFPIPLKKLGSRAERSSYAFERYSLPENSSSTRSRSSRSRERGALWKKIYVN